MADRNTRSTQQLPAFPPQNGRCALDFTTARSIPSTGAPVSIDLHPATTPIRITLTLLGVLHESTRVGGVVSEVADGILDPRHQRLPATDLDLADAESVAVHHGHQETRRQQFTQGAELGDHLADHGSDSPNLPHGEANHPAMSV